MPKTDKPNSAHVELLLPVGSIDMALAAIHNGADAIFVGIPGFNARGRSHDFKIEELKEIIDLCHTYDVKVNLAFNIVIFEHELPLVVDVLKQVLPLHPDAFIVQDLGLARLIRMMAPNQRIHASTQMTVTNYESIALLEDLDIKRFVLGRENSIEEIKAIKEKTDRELEVFVHGALCVSYSGQCFTSESLGGRSANRGQCAQSCRFSYELYVDDHKLELGDKKYLVSPQDLCGIEHVSELVKAGVDCFKVEGRLKTPEYVATSARAYREALDGTVSNEQKNESIRKMAVNFSRGFFSGWLEGVNHQRLVPANFSSHRGFEIGRIVDVFKNFITIELSNAVSLVPGDGILWAKNDREEGGFIYGVENLRPSLIRIQLARDVQAQYSEIGAIVYQNHDKELKKTLAQNIEDKTKKKRLPIDISLVVKNGHALVAKITDSKNTVEGSTTLTFTPAERRGVSDEQLKEEFSSLTGSLFKLKKILIERESSEELFLPHRAIKELRQRLIQQLSEMRLTISRPQVLDDNDAFTRWLTPERKIAVSLTQDSKFTVLLREKGQVDDLLASASTEILSAIDCVILDFEFGRDYQASVQALRQAKVRVGLATTRILKPNEYRNLKYLLSLQPDVLLVRNLGALYYFTKENPVSCELRGDFSLNVTNHLTADYLFKKRLSTLCLSYDLNHRQVLQVLENAPAQNLEVTLFQYMPSFHMEHCVFAAFLSSGSSYRDCGKPCEKHDVRLKDQFDHWHQIKPDQECRNTMYHATSQSAARFWKTWQEHGLGYVRYEALKERGDELLNKIATHIDLLQGRIDSDELYRRLGALEAYGLSEGQLHRDKEYQARKKSPNHSYERPQPMGK